MIIIFSTHIRLRKSKTKSTTGDIGLQHLLTFQKSSNVCVKTLLMGILPKMFAIFKTPSNAMNALSNSSTKVGGLKQQSRFHYAVMIDLHTLMLSILVADFF